MPYKKAVDVLPPELIEAVSKYLDGGLIYFPKRSEKLGWGVVSGSRSQIEARNKAIVGAYEQGDSVQMLSQQFYLSEDSIRRIIKNRHK